MRVDPQEMSRETGTADLADDVMSADEPVASRDTKAQRMGQQADSPISVEFIENTPPLQINEVTVTEGQGHVDDKSEGSADPLRIDAEVRCMAALRC